MAKTPANAATTATTSGQLFETDEPIPAKVQSSVDAYVKSLRAANKARETLNANKDDCIDVMRQHGVRRVRIDEGAKWLVLDEKFNLKTEKIKEQQHE